jgi:hypothetical protein
VSSIELKPGSFYWVLIALDADADEEWENNPMPARYRGEGLWDLIGQELGTHWPVRWVGPEIALETRA